MMEWKKVKLGSLCINVTSGGTPKSTDSTNFNPPTIPWLKTKEVNFNRIYDTENYISQKGFETSSTKIIPENSIIVAMYGQGDTAGRVALNKIPLTTNQACCNLTINPDKAYFEYVFYYMWTLYSTMVHLKNGGAQPNLNAGIIKDLDIALPSFQDQCCIASILSSLDKKIETNNKINANLEEMAQAIFKNWFVDFAPFKDGKFVESELGMIPEGWRVGKAEDFYTINIGKTPPRSEKQCFSDTKENNKIWVSIADLGGCGTFIDNSKEYLTCDAQNKYNVSMVPAGSVLLSFKLTIGRVAIADVELTTNEAIARFLLSNDNYREFTYLYLKQYQYDNLGSTSSIATAVNSKIIKSMQFLMPTENVVNTFSNSVKPLFEKIRLNQQENARLASLRDTLLPRLMSGEIEV